MANGVNIGSFNLLATMQLGYTPIAASGFGVANEAVNPLAQLASGYANAVDPLASAQRIVDESGQFIPFAATQETAYFADGRIAKWVRGVFAPGRSEKLPVPVPAASVPVRIDEHEEHQIRRDSVMRDSIKDQTEFDHLMKEIIALLDAAEDNVGHERSHTDGRPWFIYPAKADEALQKNEIALKIAYRNVAAMRDPEYRKYTCGPDPILEGWLEKASRSLSLKTSILRDQGKAEEAVQFVHELVNLCLGINPAGQFGGFQGMIISITSGVADALAGVDAVWPVEWLAEALVKKGSPQMAVDMLVETAYQYAHGRNFKIFRRFSISAGDMYMHMGDGAKAAEQYQLAFLSFVKTPFVDSNKNSVKGDSFTVYTGRLNELASILQRWAAALTFSKENPDVVLALRAMSAKIIAQAEGIEVPKVLKQGGEWRFIFDWPDVIVKEVAGLLPSPTGYEYGEEVE